MTVALRLVPRPGGRGVRGGLDDADAPSPVYQVSCAFPTARLQSTPTAANLTQKGSINMKSRFALALVAAASWGTVHAQTPDEFAEALRNWPRPALLRQLNQSASLNDYGKTAANLESVLDILADRYDLTLIVDNRAFERQGQKRVLTLPVPEQLLKRKEKMPIGDLLQAVLDAVPVASGATWFPRGDYLEITTRAELHGELAGVFRGLGVQADYVGDTLLVLLQERDWEALDLVARESGTLLSSCLYFTWLGAEARKRPAGK